MEETAFAACECSGSLNHPAQGERDGHCMDFTRPWLVERPVVLEPWVYPIQVRTMGEKSMIRINLSHCAADTGQMTPLSLKTVRSQASVDCVCIKQLNSWAGVKVCWGYLLMRSIFISVVRFPSVSSPATVVGSLLTSFILRSKTWSPAVCADGGARRARGAKES